MDTYVQQEQAACRCPVRLAKRARRPSPPAGQPYPRSALLQGKRRMVPKAGIEPARGCPQRFLRPSRLPFRHFGRERGRFTTETPSTQRREEDGASVVRSHPKKWCPPPVSIRAPKLFQSFALPDELGGHGRYYSKPFHASHKGGGAWPRPIMPSSRRPLRPLH